MSLKELLLENKTKSVLYVVGVILTSTTNIIFTFGMSNAFAVLEAENLDQILRIFIVSLVLMVIPSIIQFISRMMRVGFMSEILRKVRLLSYQKIMNQDIETHSKLDKERHRAALISDINLFEKDFFMSLLQIGVAVLSSILSLIILLRYSWVVALTSLLIGLLQIGIAKYYEKRVREARRQTQVSNIQYNNVSSNLVSGFKTIKSFASEAPFLN